VTEDQRELEGLLKQLSQDSTDAMDLFRTCQFIRLNTLLHKMERKCYVASLFILDITDLAG
jgi:hypothetical protein